MAQATSAGITYFDTAEDYAAGASETQLGGAVAALPQETRASVVIGSKILPNHCADVAKHVEGTLRRLGVPQIDLYMVHWPIDRNSMAHFAGAATTASGGRDYAAVDHAATPEAPPTERAFRELMSLQAAGKIKHIGVSNFGVAQLREALATGVTIAVNQLCYNLIFRAIEFEILPFCVEHGIGVFAYSPLMQGILTGAYTTADQVPVYRARTRHFDGRRPKSRHGEPGHEALLFETLAALRKIAADAAIPMHTLAMAFPLTTPGVCCVIGGVTKEEQIASNAAAVATAIPEAVLADVRRATEALKQAMGSNADLWQGADGRIM